MLLRAPALVGHEHYAYGAGFFGDVRGSSPSERGRGRSW